MRLTESTFGAKWLFLKSCNFTYSSEPLKRTGSLYYELFSFSLTAEHIQLHNLRLSNCLWNHNACRLLIWKIFLFQMLGETSIFTLSGKVPLWLKCQNDVLCGNMNIDVSLYILKYKCFFKDDCSQMTACVHGGLL